MTQPADRTLDLLILAISVPVVGILMGGIYSLPAMRVTDSRDPGYTLLLGAGLSLTVIGIGAAGGLSPPLLAGSWAFAMLLLIVRRLLGKLDHNVERFGQIHALALIGVLLMVRLFGSG